MRKAGPPREVPPPLEMVCLNVIFKLGEGNAGDVRRELNGSKPLAYTTVLTLLERLTKKGVLSRHKRGRAFVYSPTLSRNDLRRAALREFSALHFDGDDAQLAAYLAGGEVVERPPAPEPEPASMDATLL